MSQCGDPLSEAILKRAPFLRSVGASVAIILLISLFWRLCTFTPPQPLGYDEAIYKVYVQTLENDGIRGLRSITQDWPENTNLNKGPLPYRLLYIVLGVWVNTLVGGDTIVNLATMSLVFGLGIIVTALLLARRWLGPVCGFLVALLMVFSPLATALSSRALQDMCVAFVFTIGILFFDRAWREGRRRDVFLLGIALLAGFLTKESMVCLYPSYMLAAVYYARTAAWRNRIHLVLPFVLAPMIHLAIVCWVSGGMDVVLRTYRAYSTMQSSIPYAVKYQGGAWHRYLVDFMLLSPMPFLLAIVGITAGTQDSKCAQGKHLSLIYLLSGLVVFTSLPILNVRIVLFLELFLRTLAVLGVFSLCKRIPASALLQSVAAVGILGLIIASDILQFHAIFSISKVYDPVTAELIRGSGFVR